jgi:hypothetical protein
MSARQRFIVWGLICAVVAAGIYPPWAVRGVPAGYHLIFAPPSNRGAIHVDQSRLMIEWIICTVIAAGLYFAWPLSVRVPRPPAPTSPKKHRWFSKINPMMIPLGIALVVTICGTLLVFVLPNRPQRVDWESIAKEYGGTVSSDPPQEESTAVIEARPASEITATPAPQPDYDALAERYGAKDVTPSPIHKARVREFAPDELSPAYSRPALAPNGMAWPTKSGYFEGFEQRNTGGRSNLTVDNSKGGSDVVASVYDHTHDQPMRVFFLLAHDQFIVAELTPGDYDVRYLDLSSGSISRSDPIQFWEVHSQEKDGPHIHWHDVLVTLYGKVDPEHPIHFEKIDANEFVKLPPRQ